MVQEFFSASARRWPNHPALEIPPGNNRPLRQRLSYAELQHHARHLAASIQPLIRDESVVAILLPRTTPDLYVAQLAVLFAGAAYTCIDPTFPEEQLREILTDAAAVVVFTDTDGAARVTSLGVPPDQIQLVHQLRTTTPSPAAGSVPAPIPSNSKTTPRSLAYIIYTSGTTGRPKGVMIEHRSIANLIGTDLAEFGLTPQDRVAQGSSPAYDSSVEEIWLAWAAGAALVVMDDDAARLGPDLVPWLQQERISVLCPPPTLLRTTGCADPAQALPGLRLLYVGGEALPQDVADRWSVGRRLENGYGPTECTVTALRTRIRAGDEISIGRPVPGLHAWVLNDSLHEVPAGEMGELCLGGISLARGYRNRPELTGEKFPTHPQLGRIYRTGDLVNRRPDGTFLYHGRIDSQVKVRGYRVELEAIEARLSECAGVREAACRVQGEGTQQLLVAWIVPTSAAAPPCFDQLKGTLKNLLPIYMVPTRFGCLTELPKSVGGKINRRALGEIGANERPTHRPATPAANPTEARIVAVFQQVFPNHGGISIHDDFFDDLGGDSLSAAIAISQLREHPLTTAITVRDLYENRSAAALAKQTGPGFEAIPTVVEPPLTPVGNPWLATVVQMAWMVLTVSLTGWLAYLAAFQILPALARKMGLVSLTFLGPILGLLAITAVTPIAVGLAAAVKWTLIGRYRPQRTPVWGSFYVRHWIVQQVLHFVPWWVIEGTEFQNLALRALGARIGKRVHLHRGVDLVHGGWDLLEIGDDVTVCQDACLQLTELEDRHLIFSPIFIGDRSTLDIHSGVGGNSRLEADTSLTPRSALPRDGHIPTGERWDGIPARPAGLTVPPPALTHRHATLSPWQSGVCLMAARLALLAVLALPAELLTLACSTLYQVGTEDALAWLEHPSGLSQLLVAVIAVATLSVPLTVFLEALICRALGRIPAGVTSRWEVGYLRIWLKSGLVDSAARWLYGTLFWPFWLRCAGMKIGRGCEISGLIDTLPETVEISANTFCADGIYIGGAKLHRGTVTVAPVQLGTNTFLGNGVVIAAGQKLPDDLLLGVGTVADDSVVRRDSAWFGHPPFELPRRQVIEEDRSLTHDPSPLRYANRVFWELLRFALPIVPAALVSLWVHWMLAAKAALSGPVFVWLAIPAIHFSAILTSALFVIGLKWALLGRVKPGVHALWSCWASRWDFICLAWSIYAIDLVLLLEGSLLLNALLRTTGVQVGRRVVLGGGFAHDLPDPDMLTVDDDATVDCLFQAHTFEDRVLKLDRVRIHRGATVGQNAILLYGAEVGARTRVSPHSVVMKHERLLPGRVYAGFPTRARVNEPSAVPTFSPTPFATPTPSSELNLRLPLGEPTLGTESQL